jgi:Ca2+-binding EF-hand superfamily protein
MAFALTSRGDLHKKLDYAFDLYDTDRSGTLNSLEVREVLIGMLDLLGMKKV